MESQLDKMTTKIEKQDAQLDAWVEIMHEIREHMVNEVKGRSIESACNSQTIIVNQPLLQQEAGLLANESKIYNDGNESNE